MAVKRKNGMTSTARFDARMRGQTVDRIPNLSLIMQFGAEHIGQKLADYYQDYNVLSEANFRCAEDFDLDLLDAISDPYRETADFGAEIVFPEDDLPLCREPLLQDVSDLAALPTPDPMKPGSRMRDRIDAIRLFRERAGDEIPVQGWVEGALAEAADLRGVVALMYDRFDRADWVEELLERCCEVAISFAVAQVEAGATIIGLGDAIASQMGPEAYKRFGLPYEQRIFAAVRKAGGIGRLHICGDTSAMVKEMCESGAAIVDLDWQVNLKTARAEADEVDPMIALCGNFDPVSVLYQGTQEQIKAAVRACRDAGGDNWLCAPGCEVPRYTPEENMHAMTEALR